VETSADAIAPGGEKKRDEKSRRELEREAEGRGARKRKGARESSIKKFPWGSRRGRLKKRKNFVKSGRKRNKGDQGEAGRRK